MHAPPVIASSSRGESVRLGEDRAGARSRGILVAAARVIVVDAYDDRAADFYRRHGFVSIPGASLRLVQKTCDVVLALGV